MLDCGPSLFVWLGGASTAEERSGALDTARRFAETSPFSNGSSDVNDNGVTVIQVHAGHEPAMFTHRFRSWDPELCQSMAFKDPYEAKLKALSEAKVMYMYMYMY